MPALAAIDAPRLRIVADDVADPVIRRVAIAVERAGPGSEDDLAELEAVIERAASVRT